EAWHPAPRQTASELPPPAFTASRTVAEVIEERARLHRAPQAAAPQAAAAASAVAATAALNDEETAPESAEELALDDLSDALDEEMRSVSREARPSLEDEMSRLLDELTDEHRTNR
ncbi:hypothetical protein NUU27_22250, partial [Nitratireductor sp. ZSWI3]|nr:hypothetical protein [Nitratireductor sp. ZSWI3]